MLAGVHFPKVFQVLSVALTIFVLLSLVPHIISPNEIHLFMPTSDGCHLCDLDNV